uniref:Uncharacterized protein n=1 Tax=Laticauda laticaudata TaxID=8630 RepID=A0A8C5RWY6_LATLA
IVFRLQLQLVSKLQFNKCLPFSSILNEKLETASAFEVATGVSPWPSEGFQSAALLFSWCSTGALKLKPKSEPVADVFPNVKGFDFLSLNIVLTDSEPNTNLGGETTAFVGISAVPSTTGVSAASTTVSSASFKSVLSLVVSSNTATAIFPQGDSFGVLVREESGVINMSFS